MLKLGQAYDPLRDGTKRRAYDNMYPSVACDPSHFQKTQPPRPAPAPVPQSEASREAEQLAALQKSKSERAARWKARRLASDLVMSDLQQNIDTLEQELEGIVDAAATAEAAAQAQDSTWSAWLLHPITWPVEVGEEETVHQERQKQERKIEQDMKGRRLEYAKADLKSAEDALAQAKQERDAADIMDTYKIRAIEAKASARQTREAQQKHRSENDRVAREWQLKQQELRTQQLRDRVEEQRKQYAELQAAIQRREAELVDRERAAQEWAARQGAAGGREQSERGYLR